MVPITYSLKATLRAGYDAASVRVAIESDIWNYYVQAKEDNLVKYNEIHAIITHSPGIFDFTDLTMNGKTDNIVLRLDEYPATESVDLGTVEGVSM